MRVSATQFRHLWPLHWEGYCTFFTTTKEYLGLILNRISHKIYIDKIMNIISIQKKIIYIYCVFSFFTHTEVSMI